MRWMVNGGADSNKSSSRSTHSAASGSPLAAASDGGAAAASRSPAGVGAPAGGRLSTCDDVVAPSSAAKSANARIISTRIPTRSGSQLALRCCARGVRVRLCEPEKPFGAPPCSQPPPKLRTLPGACPSPPPPPRPPAAPPSLKHQRRQGSPPSHAAPPQPAAAFVDPRTVALPGRGAGPRGGRPDEEGRAPRGPSLGSLPPAPLGAPGDGQRSLQQAGGSLVTARASTTD